MAELKPCPFCGCKQLDDNVGVQYDENGTKRFEDYDRKKG